MGGLSSSTVMSSRETGIRVSYENGWCSATQATRNRSVMSSLASRAERKSMYVSIRDTLHGQWVGHDERGRLCVHGCSIPSPVVSGAETIHPPSRYPATADSTCKSDLRFSFLRAR